MSLDYRIIPRASAAHCGYDFIDERDLEGGRAGIPFLHIRQDLDYLRDPDNPALRELELAGPSYRWNNESFTMFASALVQGRELALQFREMFLWSVLMEHVDGGGQTVTSTLLGPSESFIGLVCQDRGVADRVIEISRGRMFSSDDAR